MTFLCFIGTPFGFPVDPEVYIIAAISSGLGVFDSEAAEFLCPIAHISSNSINLT